MVVDSVVLVVVLIVVGAELDFRLSPVTVTAPVSVVAVIVVGPKVVTAVVVVG